MNWENGYIEVIQRIDLKSLYYCCLKCSFFLVRLIWTEKRRQRFAKRWYISETRKISTRNQLNYKSSYVSLDRQSIGSFVFLGWFSRSMYQNRAKCMLNLECCTMKRHQDWRSRSLVCFSKEVTVSLRSRPHYPVETWKRRFHSENASNVRRPWHYIREN